MSLPAQAQSATPTGYDLINTVNQLRASNGLPALEIDGTLMAIAQAHSEYQASIGHWTHNGANGSQPTDRATSAGYGGGQKVIVSENVAVTYAAQNLTVEDVVYEMWSDAVHWNTMINPNYKHVGAGVAEKDGKTFFTLDVGWVVGGSPAQTTAPQAPAENAAPLTGSLTAIPGTAPAAFFSEQAATPLPDGSVIHEVQFGQALERIAKIYNVTVKEIAALNQITPDAIYVGQRLLIKPSVIPEEEPTNGRLPTEQTAPGANPGTQTSISEAALPSLVPTANAQPTANGGLPPGVIIVIITGLLGVIAVSLFKPGG